MLAEMEFPRRFRLAWRVCGGSACMKNVDRHGSLRNRTAPADESKKKKWTLAKLWRYLAPGTGGNGKKHDVSGAESF